MPSSLNLKRLLSETIPFSDGDLHICDGDTENFYAAEKRRVGG
jgi:hypothetical protein